MARNDPVRNIWHEYRWISGSEESRHLIETKFDMDDRNQHNKKDCSEVDWRSIAIPQRTSSKGRRNADRVSISSILLILGALGGHAALGYFGYGWIRSQSAPAIPANAAAVPIHAAPRQILPPATAKSPAPKDHIVGKLHWSRHDGMGIKSDPAENWKCAGGYIYSTTMGANGSRIIELVQENNRPLRCKG